MPQPSTQHSLDFTPAPSALVSEADTLAASLRSDSSDDGGDVEGVQTQRVKTSDADLENVEKQETVVSIHHPSSFPDGGKDAWLCILGGFFASFCSFGWINCIGIFQAYYQQHQLAEYSPSTVSWIPSLEVFFMFISSPFIGKYFDSHGPRGLILLGTFLHVFGLMMASVSSEYYQFVLTQGLISGVGCSMIFNPSVVCAQTWFFKKRALASGILASGSSLGGVIFPIMIRRLIVSHGFGWAMRVTALLILGCMVVANLTVKSRLPPRPPQPFQAAMITKHFKEAKFNVCIISSFFFFFGLFIPLNYLPGYAQNDGMSAELSFYTIAVLNGASTFGRIIPGYIGDKVGRYNLTVVITLLSGIVVLAVWLPTRGDTATLIFAPLYGFVSGAFVSIGPALIAQISDPKELGIRTGLMFMVIAFGALAGNPIAGALINTYRGAYTGLQIFSGTVLVFSGVLFIFTRVVVGGTTLRRVV